MLVYEVGWPSALGGAGEGQDRVGDPEQLPEVTGTSRGNTGFPATPRERPRKIWKMENICVYKNIHRS